LDSILVMPLIPPPPCPTLFPYTTLFRSTVAGKATTMIGADASATVGGNLQEQIEGLRQSLAGGGQRLEAPITWLGSDSVNVLQVDRKSTRLNFQSRENLVCRLLLEKKKT